MINTNIGFKLVKSNTIGKTIVFYHKYYSKIDNGYVVKTLKRGHILSGFIDLFGDVIIDFDIMDISNYFYANNFEDIGILFSYPNDTNKFYHLRKDNNSYKVVFETDNDKKLIVNKIEHNPNNWLIVTNEDLPQLMLYDVRKAKIISTTFDNLEVVNDNPIHKYYYEKILYTDDLEEAYLTTLCGFLDKDGNFSSDILDMESDNLLYDGKIFKNTLSADFNRLCEALELIYADKYYKKKQEIDIIINNLIETPCEQKECGMAKIYHFDNRRKV